MQFLIIGNGIAGATTAEILRNEDSAADITVVADDPFPVYYRPALKDYLGGKIREDKLWARPISFYSDRRVRFLAGRVVGIQAAQHSVQLSSGQTIGYSRLLLAHGARASTLTCPGLHLAGVTTLRTVADYQRVLSHLHNVRRVVVTGSGTLALESIETLRHRGFQVTHLLRRRTLWSEVLDPIASDLVLQQEKRDGVDVRYEQEIAEITGQNGQVRGIVTTTGVQIPCELVLLGIGIEPIIDFVKSAGIACGRGVKVDSFMRTSASDIYAAGDLIETPDPLTGRSRVIGQWYPSIQQARAAAYSMLDLLEAGHQFRFGNFYNATFLYGLDFASVGISTLPKGGSGYVEIAADPQPRTYQKVILKDGVPVGMLALGDRKSVLTFKRAIDAGVNLSSVASRLFAPDFELGKWLDQQGVPAAILGVNREGAVAIKKVAYADAGNRSAILKQHALTEAILVPVAPPEIKSSMRETYLSQTKVMTIGRQEGVNLPVGHGTISRRHAEISCANGQYVLRDLKSRNGTFINNQRLEPGSLSILKSNDRVRFGDVIFTFSTREVEAASSMLFRRPKIEAPPPVKGTSPSERSTATVPAEDEMPSLDDNASAEKTMLLQMTPPSKTQQGQPFLNPDGSLMLPGATVAVPVGTLSTIKDTPILVAIVQGKPRVFPLRQGQRFILGRDKGNSIVLADMSISRKHAEVFPGPDGFYIRDLASSSGVLVNSAGIDSPYRLSNGDRIAMGSIMLYFIDQGLQLPQIVGNRLTAFYGAHGAMQAAEPAHPPQAPLPAPCHNCGSVNNSVARFCQGCGAPL